MEIACTRALEIVREQVEDGYSLLVHVHRYYVCAGSLSMMGLTVGHHNRIVSRQQRMCG